MHTSFGREVATTIMKATVVVVTIVAVIASISALYDVESSISDGSCNVAVLPIEGTILPFYGLTEDQLVVTPEIIESFMTSVEEEPAIKAVLIEVNSPGGTPVAAQRIAERLRSSPLPVVGLIGDMGASGGYMIAAATDHLITSPMSDVGSIGVTMSYLEESEKNDEEGLTYVQLTTGKFKDAGSPNRPITDEERELFQRDLDVIHNEFITLVARYRNKPFDEIKALADGSSMTGVRALEVGLVDGLGGRTEAQAALAKVLNIDFTEVKFCEYDRGFLLF